MKKIRYLFVREDEGHYSFTKVRPNEGCYHRAFDTKREAMVNARNKFEILITELRKTISKIEKDLED